MAIDFTLTSVNNYQLIGSLTTNLALDSSNPGGGVVLAEWNTYDDGTYDDETYEPAAVYSANIDNRQILNFKVAWSSTGDSNDIKFQYRTSQNGISFTPWNAEIDATTIKEQAIMGFRYYSIRFIFESSLWSDSDSIESVTISDMDTILKEIKKHKMKVFRRLFMRRRLATDGEYEANWVQVPNADIVKFGTIKSSIDDVIPGFFKYSGLNFELMNDVGTYSNVNEDKSFFFGAATISRTLIKVEAGYENEFGTEFPTDPTLYIGLISDNPTYTESSRVKFKTKHLSSVLDEFPSDQIVGLGSTQTASDIITKIRDHTDSVGTAIFQKFISLGAWNFTTTTQNYDMATSTSLQGLSCWKLMQQLAVSEENVMFMTRTGDFNFVDNDLLSSASSFHFSGIGDSDRTSGHNIARNISVVEDVRKVFNRIKIQYDKDDTTTSFEIKNEVWNWGNVSSSSFLYGVREFKYKNTFLNASTSAVLASTLFDDLSFPKTRINIESKFIPHLSVNDQVTITYKTRKTIGFSGVSLWGEAVIGEDRWGERLGFNIEVDNLSSQILNLDHNIDKFSSKARLKEQ